MHAHIWLIVLLIYCPVAVWHYRWYRETHEGVSTWVDLTISIGWLPFWCYMLWRLFLARSQMSDEPLRDDGTSSDPATPKLCTTSGKPWTDESSQDRGDGQQKDYRVLCEEERAKGFVRPVRRSYQHVGARPKYPTRPLTAEERVRFGDEGYTCFEPYPPERSPAMGRFWTEQQLHSGCGVVTTMGQALAETYARNPRFYGATFCCGCGKHLPVGDNGEFVWDDGSGERVGT
ncbi:MAG TPA: hypothetical protein VGM20_04440 [Gemmatimonadales bacterium]